MEKASNILNHLLSNLLQKKQNKKGTVYFHFFNKWEIIVGKKLYGHTKIIDVKNGSLVIAVDHPGWLQMLRMKDKIVIKKVQKMFPQLNIKSMKIHINEKYFKLSKDMDKEKEKNEDKKTNNNEYPHTLDEIRDKKLQNILKRLFMSIAKKDEES